MEEYVRHVLSKAEAYSLQLEVPDEDDDFEDLEGYHQTNYLLSQRPPMAISIFVHGESTYPASMASSIRSQ
jgi:hypothetical protein